MHGSTPEVVDGDLPGAVVIIEFPDVERARAWYRSPGTARHFWNFCAFTTPRSWPSPTG